MNINDRVKEIRQHAGLNQNDFGKRIAVGQGYLSQIEKGDRDVTEKILKLICLEFNVNENWLRTGEGDMIAELERDEAITIWAAQLTQKDDNDFAKRFASMLTKLDESQWKALENMATMLFEEKNKKD